MLLRLATDINVHPDLNGLPANVLAGLAHLANNAAGLLVVVSGIGIAISLIGWVFASSAVIHSSASARSRRWVSRSPPWRCSTWAWLLPTTPDGSSREPLHRPL